jgi:hypothetical protein
MSAPFRIERPAGLKAGVRLGGGGDTFKDYLERLLKMIPGEVVGAYLIGTGFIPSENRIALAVWSAICLVLVVIVRRYGTADPDKRQPAQPVPVFVSSVAFVIWVYSLGGPFEKFELYVPWIGSLGVLLWSFLIPYFYKGPKT